ncbi:hypothetical protein NYZ99_10265 [Maribacter litopenaei]|uniref:Lipocalin-like domain-containing protein n=1 Tax=Maribacter litopenaei TaxID=2976127 RepID=A0ABY5YBY4_9FLAO|nr:hypothetical protein [Maribacter litopenaei]UWX56531.1 hypothetical protein NYZ99_10265 [Maribacter litopenaei]
MKILKNTFKNFSLLATMLIVAYSCSEDADNNDDIVLSQADLKAVLETDEITGGIDVALFELYNNDGSTAKTMSNECYSAQYTDTGYVATFNNCVLNGTENINGTLTVTYNMDEQQASFSASYVDFYVGDIKINGTRSYQLGANSDAGSVSFEVTSDLTVEMADGSIISDNGTKAFTLTFGDSAESTTFSIAGTWTVVYEGNTYNVTVNTPLTSSVTCGYIAAGDMTVSKNGLTVNVDFGDSTCDNVATVTYPNGVEEEITLRD